MKELNRGIVVVDHIAVEFLQNGSIVAVLDMIAGSKETLQTLAKERGYTYYETQAGCDIYKSKEGNFMHISPMDEANGRDG